MTVTRWILSLGGAVIVAAVATALVLSGTSTNDTATVTRETPTSTAAPTATQSPSPTLTRQLPPTSTPTPLPTAAADDAPPPVTNTIWLVEVSDMSVTTLYEDAEWGGSASFVASGDIEMHVRGDDGTVAVSLDLDGGVVVDGRFYADAICGRISPNNRWMTYEVPGEDIQLSESFSVRTWAQWVVNLKTGETRELQFGLLGCGGCDSRFGVQWSPSGDYLTYEESGGQRRRFLSNAATGETRDLGQGFWTEWSQIAEHTLLYGGFIGPVTIEDLETGELVRLAGEAARVTFDPSGRYLYTWGPGPGGQTLIFDARTGERIGELSGQRRPNPIWDPQDAVVGVGGVFVAALEDARCSSAAPDSDSTGFVAIYDNSRQIKCFPGTGPSVSPDGQHVVLAQEVAGASGLESFQHLYDILVVNTATGMETVIGVGVISYSPPRFVWNDAGTHLLITWPVAGYSL